MADVSCRKCRVIPCACPDEHLDETAPELRARITRLEEEVAKMEPIKTRLGKWLTEGEGWFEFGKHSDGSVDIANSEGDVLTKLPHELAGLVIKAHNESIDRVSDKIGRRG